MILKRADKTVYFCRFAFSFMLVTVMLLGNTPIATAAVAPTQVELSAKVAYTVANAKADPERGQFMFRVNSQIGNASATENIYLNSEGGYLGLGSYTFYKAGEYTLTVQQVDQGKAGDTYDLALVTVNISVQEVNGSLKASVSYTKGGNAVNEIVFNNSSVGNTLYEISANADKAVYSIGELITYTVDIVNTGDAPVYGIYVRQYVPQGTTFASISGTGGAYGAIEDRDHGTWFIQSLGKGASVSLRLTVRVNSCCPSILNARPLCDVTGNTERIYTNDPSDPEIVVSTLVARLAA